MCLMVIVTIPVAAFAVFPVCYGRVVFSKKLAQDKVSPMRRRRAAHRLY